MKNFILSLLFMSITFAQSTITGLVLDQSTGLPLKDANVSVLDDDGTTIAGTSTDDSGKFALSLSESGKVQVSVIGYKKFFTPNGDGYHDKWRILGIREDFQPNSRVYIFDRYGKLIKELDPVTEGWDGTYLGRPMPQTDYWFRVFLEDGREFKGHFSLVRGK